MDKKEKSAYFNQLTGGGLDCNDGDAEDNKIFRMSRVQDENGRKVSIDSEVSSMDDSFKSVDSVKYKSVRSMMSVKNLPKKSVKTLEITVFDHNFR